MTPGLIDAALELKERSRPEDRMVTDLDPRSHWDIFQESTVGGLAGLRSVGHVTPPPWKPDGIAPFFRTAAWSQLWQAGDTRVLPSLGARWLLTSEKEHTQSLRAKVGKDFLKEVASFEEATVWRYLGPLDHLDKPIPEAKLVGVEIENPKLLQGETSQPLILVLDGVPAETEIDLSVAWLPQEGTQPGDAIEPLTLRDTSPLGVKPWRFLHALVPPLVEGKYRLEVLLNGQKLPMSKELESALLVEFDWTSQAKKAIAKLDSEKGIVTLSVGEEVMSPPLTVGMRLFRLDEQRYNRPFGFEARGIWSGQPEVILEPTDFDFGFPVPDGQRAELFLLDRSGREVPLSVDGGR